MGSWRRKGGFGEGRGVAADAGHVGIETLVGLVADNFLFVNERRTDCWQHLICSIFFGEEVCGCGEGLEGGVAGVDEGVAERASEGCNEHFAARVGTEVAGYLA